jgi:hypothetical protein
VVNGRKGLSHGPPGTGVAVGVMVAVAVGMAVLVGVWVGGMGVVVAQAVRTNKKRSARFFFMAYSPCHSILYNSQNKFACDKKHIFEYL